MALATTCLTLWNSGFMTHSLYLPYPPTHEHYLTNNFTKSQLKSTKTDFPIDCHSCSAGTSRPCARSKLKNSNWKRSARLSRRTRRRGKRRRASRSKRCDAAVSRPAPESKSCFSIQSHCERIQRLLVLIVGTLFRFVRSSRFFLFRFVLLSMASSLKLCANRIQ